MKQRGGEKSCRLASKYPPSEPCGCEICRAYCRRPGWWTVKEAKRAIDAGYANRMMLEMSPDFSFGVLSPAFYGCENDFARQEFASAGCSFLKEGLCELHGTGHMPLECRFCHHTRTGLGQKCHGEIERDWKRPEGKALVDAWCKNNRLLQRYGLRQG